MLGERRELTDASVKKPTPATIQTLTWNHLEMGGSVDHTGEKSGYGREFSIVNLSQSRTTALVKNKDSVRPAFGSGRFLWVRHWKGR